MGPYPLFAEVQKWVGRGQQDCHEVLMMLVDWLSEDLNRVQGRKVPIQVSLHSLNAIITSLYLLQHIISLCIWMGKACLYFPHASMPSQRIQAYRLCIPVLQSYMTVSSHAYTASEKQSTDQQTCLTRHSFYVMSQRDDLFVLVTFSLKCIVFLSAARRLREPV